MPTTRPQALMERRQDPNSQAIVVLITDLGDQVRELKTAVNELKRANIYTHGITQEFLDNAVKKAMESAFPSGDPDGHRLAHEAAIKSAEARAEFWAAMCKEVGKWGFISLLGFLFYWAWTGLLKGPRI